jgi:excisionase family DNA binding protein
MPHSKDSLVASMTSAVDAGLLDWQEAAGYLAITPRHLRRLAQERRISHTKVGALVRFRRADLDAYIDANTREAVR